MKGRPVTRLLRSLVSGAFFVAYGAGSVLIGLLVLPVAAVCGSRAGRGRRMRSVVRASYRLFVWAARVVWLFRVESSDFARISSIRGSVVVANHLTLIDIVILMSILPDSTCVVKGAAASNPFLGCVVRPLYLVRGDDTEKLMGEASSLLGSGVNVVVFPEGTRTPEDAPHPLNRGFARIALAAGVPVAPVRITCDPPVLAKHQPWYDVADREIVFTLNALEGIQVSGPSTHSAAVALADAVHGSLFGKEQAK